MPTDSSIKSESAIDTAKEIGLFLNFHYIFDVPNHRPGMPGPRGQLGQTGQVGGNGMPGPAGDEGEPGAWRSRRGIEKR